MSAPEPRVPAALRRLVAERARGFCEYCRAPRSCSLSPFCIEHITPASRGGPSHSENLAWSCAGCNGHKSDRTQARDPLTRRLGRLFHPRLDQWEEHFEWLTDATVLAGKTAVGRATITALKLNREELVKLRRLLIRAGEHPPLARIA